MDSLGYGTNNQTTEENHASVKYDHDGAKNFIIVTVVVYSLIGTLTVMLLRMCRRVRSSAKFSERSDEVVNQYIRISGDLRRQADRQQMRYHTLKTKTLLDERSAEPSAVCRSVPGDPVNIAGDARVGIAVDSTEFNSKKNSVNTTPFISAPFSELEQNDFGTVDDANSVCYVVEETAL